MPHLLLKDLPRYECLLEASREFPELDPSATEVLLHLLRAGDEAFRLLDAQLAEHEISQGRFGVLMALWGNCRRAAPRVDCSLTPAELADRTGVTRATITGLVDSLERAGLVQRRPHGEDRRMLRIGLTARGERLLTAIMPQHFRRMAWLIEPLGEGERRIFVRLLDKVMARAAQTGPKSSAAVEDGRRNPEDARRARAPGRTRTGAPPRTISHTTPC